MKKLLSILLITVIAFSLAACGAKGTVADPSESPAVSAQPEEATPTPEEEAKGDEKAEEPTKAPSQKPSEKPTQTPSAAPSEKPSEKPTQTPVSTQKPTEAPTPTPAPATLGHTLLADFKAKAASGMSAQAIAEALVTNPAIKFSGGAMAVEEGLLSGFDNAEIKGFKNGSVFMPMIGSIPFIGYVFELENAADAASFIKKLESSANLRWNICVTPDEMVTGSQGNKVFFVMCPEKLED